MTIDEVVEMNWIADRITKIVSREIEVTLEEALLLMNRGIEIATKCLGEMRDESYDSRQISLLEGILAKLEEERMIVLSEISTEVMSPN